ncbi:hypothetical protein TWF718_010761 [Orbilia javanica]|uniref:UvrD-like helicase ATP-binding domain-containing protein n=1 Tax=Orbilia javanica TaxID=47235 RepID=A0AAN8MI45_9PEZI
MDYKALALSKRNQNVLQDMILSKKEPEASDHQKIYEILVHDKTPIVALLERSPRNHHFRSAFVASPDDMLPRLSCFVRCLRLSLLPQNAHVTRSAGGIGSAIANQLIRIPAAFTKHVILVLASEPPTEFDIGSSGYQDFVLSVLDLYVSLAGIAAASLVTLRDLITKVLDMPYRVQIVERIVSEPAGAAVFAKLLANDSLIRQVFKGGSLRLFGSRLAKLITSCIASHGSDIETIVLVWEEMEAVYEHIDEQIGSIESRAQVTAVGGAPINLTEAEQDLLKSARIAMPYNITTARHTLGALQERHSGQVSHMLSSFPCRACKAQLLGRIKFPARHLQELEPRREFADINAPLGIFPIYFSDNAMRDLKSSRVDGNLSRILSTLQKLADGMWESDSELSVSKAKPRARSGPILRAARWDTGGYIVWERGVGRAEENPEEWTQIIKIIRIGSRGDMKRIESDALKAQRTYTKEYRQAAAVNVQNPTRPGALMPKRFTGKDATGLELNSTVIIGPSSLKKLAPSDALVLHKIFCTGKQYYLTKRVAEMILQGGSQVEVPFVVSPEEESIINYFGSSVCILGRSGTGKTTCLVFRLLATYIRDRLMNDRRQARQIFLTRSPVLAGKIRQYVSRLINSHCMRFSIQDDITEASDFDRILDEDKVVNSGLIDVDDNDWPMVCTYDTFATMLERSLRFAQRNIFFSDLEDSQVEVANRRVEFGKFKRSYWPSFPASAKKNLSVDGVFSEIIGVIKLNSSASNYLPLTEEQYQNLSHRAAPNFRQGPEREAVYALYKIYEKRKSSFGEWDDLDRTSKLRKLLAQDDKISSRLRSQITEVFVDEIQDQRVAEMELLLDLVNDAKSFAFAGDTAQCISRDSCFRFQDLQNTFFRKYERLGALSKQKDLAKLSRFTLSKNYRTHNGILKLAAKVIDVLSAAFPYAIDKFSPELGDFDGPAPIVFSGFSSDIFTPREGESTTTISEFGAEQVLIVRDEEAKELLVDKMGDKVLILTILESKGMEFQDVFLFDFFSRSPCLTAFRALASSQTTGARFDDVKNSELCIELKNLYVAITRSREMLYIIEGDLAAIQPLHEMWGLGSEDPILDIVTPGDPTLQTRLDEIKQGQSPQHEWKEKGDEFFNQRMYEQAMYCYKRAGSATLSNFCAASIEERNGQDFISNPNSQSVAQGHYIRAASLYYECERYDKAIRCYESIKGYTMAANLCEELSRTGKGNYLLRAANFFKQAGNMKKAIELYKELGLHNEVIAGYRKLDLVKDLIYYLKEYRKEIEAKTYHRNARIIALSIFSSTKITDDLKRPAISLLSDEEQEELYNQFKFYEELSQLLVSQGRFEEAIQLNYCEGRWDNVRGLLNHIALSANGGSEFLRDNGAKFAERVVFHKLSTLLEDAFEKGRGSLDLELSSSSYGQVEGLVTAPILNLFQHVVETLGQYLFNKPDARLGKPGDISREAETLSNLMILKAFVLKGENILSRSPWGGVLMCKVILESASRLLDIHRSQSFVDKTALMLFFEVIPTEHFDGYNISRSSAIYNGGGYATEDVTSDELVDRILQVLRGWLVQGYDKYKNYQEREYMRRSACQHFVLRGYCSNKECPHELHQREIGKRVMASQLELAWLMALLTSYYDYIYRNGAIGKDSGDKIRDVIKYQGHIWWKRVFNNVTVISDLLQSPSARLYLVQKKMDALKQMANTDEKAQGEARMVLGCLDKFDWRLRAKMHNMSQPKSGTAKIDFWDLMDCWERMKSSKLRRSDEVQFWGYFSKVQPCDKLAMDLLNNVENCLWNQSRPLAVGYFNPQLSTHKGKLQAKDETKMTVFAPEFKKCLSGFGDFKDVHLLLNRLDRMMAIVIYIASSNDLVLKSSQLASLQNHPALNPGRRNQFNPVTADAAAKLLDGIVDVYNTILIGVRKSQKPLWYREAMSRRIEQSSVIAILNNPKMPEKIIGAPNFIQEFYAEATRRNFWVLRRGLNIHDAHTATFYVPKHNSQFSGWILKNIDLIQSKVDPIIYSHQSEKSQQPKRFCSLSVVPFRAPRNLKSLPQTEGTVKDQLPDDVDVDVTEAKITAKEEAPVHIEAAGVIQRNWRICRLSLRSMRYVSQDRKHRSITRILESPAFVSNCKDIVSQRCFRMGAFILLGLIVDIKFKLQRIRGKLEALSRGKPSMERMEKIFSGYDIVRDYNKQIVAIEISIKPSTFVSDVKAKSFIAHLVEIIHKAESLGTTVSSIELDFDAWIETGNAAIYS